MYASSTVSKLSIPEILEGKNARSSVPKTENKIVEMRDPPKGLLSPPMEYKVIVKMIEGIRGFRILPSLVHPTNPSKLVKHNYNFMTAGITKCVWNAIGAKMGIRASLIYDTIEKYVSTNGNIYSVLNRIKDTMPDYEFKYVYTDEIRQYVQKWTPRKYIDEKVDMPNFENKEIFDIVSGSDAGMPYMATKPHAKCGDADVMKEALTLCNHYMTMLSKFDALQKGKKGNFREYMSTHPLEFTYLLKRKFERVKTETWKEKVRPYYVAPLALKLLFKWVSYYSRIQSTNFHEMYEEKVISNSAYRFCWSSGGAGKIIDWLMYWKDKAIESGQIEFGAICFGDDQFWVFACPNGDMTIICPDVKSMDTNVWKIIGREEIANMNAAFRYLPSTLFLNVGQLLAKHSFNTQTLVDGAILVLKDHGLISGICLTTQLDNHMSTVIQYFVQKLVSDINDENRDLYKKYQAVKDYSKNPSSTKTTSQMNQCLSDFGPEFEMLVSEIIEHFPEYVQRMTGCRIKPETLQTQFISRNDEISKIDLIFLGYKIVFDHDLERYYPIPGDLMKCWPGLCLPSRPTGKDRAMDVLLERISGLLLSGYIFNKEFAKFAFELFEYVKNMGSQLNRIECDKSILGDLNQKDWLLNHPYPLNEYQTKLFFILGPVAVDNPKAAEFIYDQGDYEELKVNTLIDNNNNLHLVPEVDLLQQQQIPSNKIGTHISKMNYDFKPSKPKTITKLNKGNFKVLTNRKGLLKHNNIKKGDKVSNIVSNLENDVEEEYDDNYNDDYSQYDESDNKRMDRGLSDQECERLLDKLDHEIEQDILKAIHREELLAKQKLYDKYGEHGDELDYEPDADI